jgi:hypothetical protein
MVSSIKSRSSSPLKQVNEVPGEQIISQRKNMEVDEDSKRNSPKNKNIEDDEISQISGGKQNVKI